MNKFDHCQLLEGQLSESLDELQLLQDAYENLKRSTKEKLAFNEKQNLELAKENQVYLAKIGQLTGELTGVRSELDELQKENDQLKCDLRSERSQIAGLRSESRRSKNDFERIRKEQSELKKSLDSKIDLIGKLESSNASVRSELRGSVRERSELQARLDEKEEESEELEAKHKENRELTKKISLLSRDLSDYEEEMQNLKSQLETSSQRRKVVVREAEKFAQPGTLEAKLSKLEAKLSTETKLKTLTKQRLKAAKEEITSLKVRVKRKIVEIKELTAKCSKYFNKNLALENEYKRQTTNLGNRRDETPKEDTFYNHDSYLNLIGGQLSSQIENGIRNRKVLLAKRKL